MLFFRAFPRAFVPFAKTALKTSRGKLFPKDAEPEIVQIYIDNITTLSQESLLPEGAFMHRRWDFDHREIRCPVRILYGVEDYGTCYGPRWAAVLPDGQFIALPDGHVPIAPAARRILSSTWRYLSTRSV